MGLVGREKSERFDETIDWHLGGKLKQQGKQRERWEGLGDVRLGFFLLFPPSTS